ncbi:MAG: metal-dependent hydrolase [Alphaproteobacteria bacterium]|nr:MAG: metal-dependent hydrolase [Alphaproteobacteria bacterium]
MQPDPVQSTIQMRRVPFEYPDDINPHWHAGEPEWSHMVNDASLTMPYLEPFLNVNMNEALPRIKDPQVHADAIAFIKQESQHYRQHRKYNALLKNQGYPELVAVEHAMDTSFKKLADKSLAFRLAYTVGFETLTLGATEWVVGNRREMFNEADLRVASLILWHLVEETEHKTAAFDVYRDVCGGYFQRVYGLLYASFHMVYWSRQGYIAMLKKDGLWNNIRSRTRLWRRSARALMAFGKHIALGMMPGHDPRHVKDPTWVSDWMERYDAGGDGVPLLNTVTLVDMKAT